MCRLPADAPRLLGADENTSKRLNRISRRSLSSDVQAASACVDSIQWTCRPFGKVFLRVRTSVGWEINFSTPDGECRQNTHPARHNCARTAHHRTHCASTVTHHANTRGSSRLPWWCVKSILSSQRHVSYVAALVKEHFNTISLTYFTYLPYCSVFRNWIKRRNSKSASPTSKKPKMVQTDDDFEPRRIELDRNIGTDPYQIPVFEERILELTIKKRSQKIRRRLENLLSSCPTSNQGHTPITIQLKALQTGILKM